MRLLASLVLAAVTLPAQQPMSVQLFNSGLQLHSVGRWDEAIAALESAISAGYQPVGAPMYRIARAYSMKNEPGTATDWLKKAADAGFASLVQLQNDGDLANARRDPRFGAVMNQIDWNGKPCMTDNRYRAFDFWIGEWNVNSFQTGAPQGSNEVIGLLEGCVIMEQWSPHSTNRGRGRSFNFLDSNTGKWRQLYLSDQGAVLDFTGEIRNGAMHMEREYTIQGRRAMERMVFTPTPEGDVRQLWELSTDGGATWSPLFDGRYIRKRRQ